MIFFLIRIDSSFVGGQCLPPTAPLALRCRGHYLSGRFEKHTFKSLHYILASMSCEQETLRVILQNKFDRIENLVQINHAATLAVPSVLAAIWGISIKDNGIDMIPVLCLISIGLLLVWRYFAHYIDRNIASIYSHIMQLEKQLEIPRENSIFCGLIKKIIDPMKKKLKPDKYNSILKSAMDLCKDQRIKLIETLEENHNLGYRGHNIWDWVSYIVIIGCLSGLVIKCVCIQTWITCLPIYNCIFPSGFVLIFLIVLIVTISGLFFYFYDRILICGEFHVNLRDESKLIEFIEMAKLVVPKISEDC